MSTQVATQVEKKMTTAAGKTPAGGTTSTPHTGATPSKKEEGRWRIEICELTPTVEQRWLHKRKREQL
jgi:hypothetical protein